MQNSKIDPLRDDIKLFKKTGCAGHFGHNYGSCVAAWEVTCASVRELAHTMAKALVLLRKNDIKGVILPEQKVNKNILEAPKHWVMCQGLTSRPQIFVGRVVLGLQSRGLMAFTRQ